MKMTRNGFAGLFLAVALVLAWAPSVLAATADHIRQIRIDGAERVEPTTVLSYMNIKVGDAFDQSAMDEAVKSLFATGLFTDVSVYQDNAVLVVSVAENPIINEISFEGNKEIKDADLLAEVQMRPRTVFTRTKVQTDVERLLNLYRLKGQFSASIDPKIIKLDQNRVNLVFEISEGPETRIRKIEFVGNKHFSDDRLEKTVRSKEGRWYRILTSDDKYDQERMNFDKELLRRFYLDHGYADFQVASATAELSPDRKDFFLTFVLEEGPRYAVGKVAVVSHIPGLDSKLVSDAVTFESGDWYNASKLEDSVGALTTAIGNLQFNFVDVKPQVERNVQNRTIDIVFNLNEGQKSFVERINVSGNVRTLDEVVRREMTLAEGDAMNNARLRKSEQKIKDLGFFEKVDVKASEGSAPDKTVLDVAVQEKSTGDLSIGAGFSTSDGPLADFRLREKNLLGKGQDLSFSSTLSGKRNEFDLSFTEPYFLKRDLSAGFDLFHMTRDLQDQSSYDRKQDGGALRLGYPLAENWRQSLTYRLEKSDISNVKPTASIFIRQQEGERTTSSVAQRLTYDTTDSKLDPTEGFISRLDTQVAGVGGDTKYIKGKLGGTWYYPVYDEWILSVLGEGGIVAGYGGRDVRINDRFFLGGDNLRGFTDSGVGPRDSATGDALGGNHFARGSVELEFPSGLPEDLGVRLHVFSDFGTIGKLDDSGAGIEDIQSLRLSSGGGVSWRSPLGPIRVDLASPLMKESFDETETFRFSFGTRF